MQEARPEADARCDMTPVAQSKPQLRQYLGMGLVARDVGKQRGIVAAADAREMRLEPLLDAAIAAGFAQRLGVRRVGVDIEVFAQADRRFRRQGAGGLERRDELAGLDLARFHIGLIEWIDADDRAGNRNGDLEPEEFLADMLDRAEHDASNGMSGLLELGERRFVSGIVLVHRAKIDKKSIGAINLRIAQGLAIHRDQTLAVLS